MASATETKPIRIGVLVLELTQLLDLAAVDIFGCASREYLEIIAKSIPIASPFVELAPPTSIVYISNAQPGELVPVTAGTKLPCTHHFTDAAVQPGKLDILVVPGIDPGMDFSKVKDIIEWLAGHGASNQTDILSICTGIYTCGEAGLLKGRTVCGPNFLQEDLKTRYAEQEAAFVGHELRWVQDNGFWSCGSVTNGNDLVSAYLRANVEKWPKDVAEFSIKAADVGDRPQRY